MNFIVLINNNKITHLKKIVKNGIMLNLAELTCMF